MDLNQAQWRKSSRSGSDGGMCVEVATNLPGAVAMRDSKRPDGPVLLVSPSAWTAFLDRMKSGGTGS
jgi:hypothetical protein